MVVGRDYLLKKTRGPDAARHFLNTRVVPGAVNTLGAVEVALERAGRLTHIRPLFLMTLGVTTLGVATTAYWGRRSRAIGFK